MAELDIQVHNQLSPELQSLIPKFMQEHFDVVDLKDIRVQAENAEWYWKPAQVHLLAYLNGELVGFAHISKRDIMYEGKQMLFGMFGGLTVSRQHRGQGIARQLIDKAQQIAKEWNCDVMFLNTDCRIYGGMYNKFGFYQIPHAYSFIGKSGASIDDSDGMLAVVNSQEKYDLVMNSKANLFIGESNV